MIIFCPLLLYVSRVFLVIFLFFFLPVKHLDLYFCSFHVFCKKSDLYVHSKKSNNHENKNEAMKLK